ncbi:MAG: competence/damage-inducible protein A, partial [bacterium]
MKVEIISIGDELLIGQVINTNAAYLAKHLTNLGLQVAWITTVGDQAEELKSALAIAMERSDIVITTGGLGPTHDDITKTVAAEYFESGLVFRPEILERLKRAFEMRGLKMAAINEEQAQVPEKAKIISNRMGSAPGLLFEKNGKKCFILPGVPSEMKAICEETIFPMLKGQGQAVLQKTVRTTGIPESTLFERVGDISKIEEIVKVAFLPKAAGVDIRLTAKGKSSMECQQKLEQGLTIFQEKISEHIYGYDDERLEEVVAN